MHKRTIFLARRFSSWPGCRRVAAEDRASLARTSSCPGGGGAAAWRPQLRHVEGHCDRDRQDQF